MCGRYTLHANKQQLAEAIAAVPDHYSPDYNIAPGSEILTNHEQLTTMHQLRTPQNFHINARLESADTTPRFRDAWQTHRCLIPANGFYEWLNDGVRKQPYYLYPPGDALLFLAGLWFPRACQAGRPLRRTHDCRTGCRERSAPAHARHTAANLHTDWMQLRLPKDEVTAFANKVYLDKHTVSMRVNSAQHKDSKLIRATSPQTDDQLQLFENFLTESRSYRGRNKGHSASSGSCCLVPLCLVGYPTMKSAF